MEGAGLYVACQGKKVDWVLVKAICDWADGNKEVDRKARQETAARNAAAFVLHALQQGSLRKTVTASPRDDATQSANRVPSSLPTQPYFFGRDDELKTIAEAISPEARTWGALIDGPGGIGKTALAVRAGHLAPVEYFDRKIFLSAKVRELTPAGEEKLEDYMLPNFVALVTELGRELGDRDIGKTDPEVRANEVRRALSDVRALIVVDNVETFAEPERLRLYQFLSRLPGACKAIVTSRRRADIDARVVRLDRLEKQDALDLIGELAKNNRWLTKATEAERASLYEVTNGNPLLIKWSAGQLGRIGSQCRTITDACAFLASAPPDNDPLEYIFGDLLETFTDSETAVLSALVHFTGPAEVKWIAEVAGIPEAKAFTALEDLTDRALLVSDEEAHAFLLPPLAAAFLRRKRPEAVSRAADRFTDRVYAVVLENGWRQFDRFSVLEAEWPSIEAALPLFVQGESDRLQRLCSALSKFLNSSGRWDEWQSLSREAEEKAVAAGNFHAAGWRANDSGWVSYLRGQSDEVLDCASRSASYWAKSPEAGTNEKAVVLRFRGIAYEMRKDFPRAIAAYEEALHVRRSEAPDSMEVAFSLSCLADAEGLQGDLDAAERDYRDALRIVTGANDKDGVAMITGNLAELALRKRDWVSAEEQARTAMALSEEVRRLELIASNCLRLAKALAKQGRSDEGLPFARRAVDVLSRLRAAEALKAARALVAECGSSSS